VPNRNAGRGAEASAAAAFRGAGAFSAGCAGNFAGIPASVAVCNQFLAVNKLREQGMSVSGSIETGGFKGPDGGVRTWIRSTCRGLAGDRRGVTAVMFAVSAMVVLGFVGLAAEGGTWYFEKRHGQNAADAAAIAGALALAASQDPSVSGSKVAAATDPVASSVVVTSGTFSNPTFTGGATPANAVQAVVTTNLTPQFSALFLPQQQQIPVSETAVAMIVPDSWACILAGSEALGAGVGTVVSDVTANVQASGCSVAANGLSSGAITLASAVGVSAQSLVSSGGCSGCAANALMFQPQTPDPFKSTIHTFTGLSTLSTTQCNTAANAGTVPVAYATNQINCSGLSNSGNPVNLVPGTYIFYNSSITLTNGSISCSACTFIITGDSPSNIGSITIQGSTINLTAPTTNTDFSVFNGVLFYTDQRTPTGKSAVISGSQTSTLAGVMYFPTSTVSYTGNSSATPSCSVIIAANLTLSGDSKFGITGCAAMNASVPRTQSVRVVM
jgi:Flp pilus assembly protein TadG